MEVITRISGSGLGCFCRGLLEASTQLGVPEVFHAHDWQTALLPVYLRTLYPVDPALRSACAVLTVQNAGDQGWFPLQMIERLLFHGTFTRPTVWSTTARSTS